MKLEFMPLRHCYQFLKAEELKGGLIVSLPQKANVGIREEGFGIRWHDPRFRLGLYFVPSGNSEDAKTATIELMETNDELVAIFGTKQGASEGLGYANKEKQINILLLVLMKPLL